MSSGNGQSPDLSRIVSLIMQNPDLIHQIEDLARQEPGVQASESEAEAPQPIQAVQKEDASIPAAALPQQNARREKRTRLLTALRPYVSEKRSKTLDTLIGAMDLFDIIGGG